MEVPQSEGGLSRAMAEPPTKLDISCPQDSPNEPQNASPESLKALAPEHLAHLQSEGFSPEQIDRMVALGVRSLSLEEAQEMGFCAKDDERGIVSSSGLYFPPIEQQRCDDPPIRKGKAAKYLSRAGKGSKAYIPEGCKAVTEGFKDAFIASGAGVGAIAGVSHARKALPKGCGYTIIFDADGWRNPSVSYALVRAAQWVEGKIQLVPEIEGEPKAGLCEWYKAGGSDEALKAHLGKAMSPQEFLLELPKHWQGLEYKRFRKCLDTAIKLGCEILDQPDRDKLLADLKALAKKEHRLPVATIKGILSKRLRIIRSAKKLQEKLEKKATKKTPKLAPRKGRDDELLMPHASDVAAYMAEEKRSSIAWSVEAQSYFQCGAEHDGLWSSIPAEAVQSLIAGELDPLCHGEDLGYDFSYLKSCDQLLRVATQQQRWEEPEGLIPLRNGVLRVETGELMPHDPEHGFKWQLPYGYDPQATCQPIIDWMYSSQGGDHTVVQLLRAWLKAAVIGRSDLQRFAEITGPGGSGKSTYSNLMIGLVGAENIFSTSLARLESNRFEIANAQGKRLVLLADSERYGGEVAMLKRMTGGDPLPAERKNIQYTPSFVFRGMVIIVANEATRSSDLTSGLGRRQCNIPFSNQVREEAQRELLKIEGGTAKGEFLPYLPGLLNWVLAMPDEEMERLIKQTSRYVPSLQAHRAAVLCETNTIAAWLDDKCIFQEGAQTQVGTNDPSRQDHWLYASYCAYCSAREYKAVALSRFRSSLEDLCRNQLKHPEIRWEKNREQRFFWGIALRSVARMDAPCPITELPFLKPPAPAETDAPPSLPEAPCQQGFWENPPQEPIGTPQKNKPSEPKPVFPAPGMKASILKKDKDGWIRVSARGTILSMGVGEAKIKTEAGDIRNVALESLQPA